jgi:ribosomal protein S13
MPLPPRTPEQRADALAKATEARQARSALLAQVKAGELTPGQVFERADDEIVKKTRVVRVLRALPGYGPAMVTALMTASGVDEKRRVGGLTEQQRGRLLEAVTLSGAAGRVPDAGEQANATERSGGDQDETTKPQPPGLLRRAGAALNGVVETGQQAGDQATSLSPLGAALKETITRVVNALRELLLAVRGLLQTVVALLRLILAALRDGLGAVVGKVAGAVSP